MPTKSLLAEPAQLVVLATCGKGDNTERILLRKLSVCQSNNCDKFCSISLSFINCIIIIKSLGTKPQIILSTGD